MICTLDLTRRNLLNAGGSHPHPAATSGSVRTGGTAGPTRRSSYFDDKTASGIGGVIRAADGHAFDVQSDVPGKAQITRFIDTALEALGDIHMAFNNAGLVSATDR